MIYELISRCYTQQNKALFASIFLMKAYNAYSNWGGLAKLEQMRRKYSRLLSLAAEEETTTAGKTVYETDQMEPKTKDKTELSLTPDTGADISSVIPVLEKIARGITQKELVASLLPHIITLTKADKAALIIETNGEFELLGKLNASHKKNSSNGTIPLSQLNNDLYVEAIEQAIKENKKVIIRNAKKNKTLSNHPLIKKDSIKSIVCIPLQYRSKLNGILYIHSKENINPNVLKQLNFLSTHVAISLENARLYANLEENVEQRTNEIKKIQNQLAEKAKTASLGAIASGVAHEIRNPLNFIVNFADISIDSLNSIAESTHEIENATDSMYKKLEETVAQLQSNMEETKDICVKANYMVQKFVEQSELIPGKFISSPIHNIIEESIQAINQKKAPLVKILNVKINRDFDPKLGNIEVVPHEITRVLINIIDNAYDSFEQKREELGETYSPQLDITTKNLGATCEIRIRDNGNGIPAEIAPKIFAPFTSTKPFGKGVGLSLSFSQGVILQQHEGTLSFSTEEGEYTELVVTLPIEKRKIVSLNKENVHPE